MRVACIKFAGLSVGGTEKYLQNLALIISEICPVDYFYTPHYIETSRKDLLDKNNIKTIPINYKQKQNTPPYEWIESNFWDLFKENDYSFIQTARGGYREYPFYLINHTPIIESIHSFLGEDRKNIKKVILLSKWQADTWAKNGGNLSKAIIIPTLVDIPPFDLKYNLRSKLSIPEDAFVFGFHQANREDIFSSVSLCAYKIIQNKNTHFILLGGGQKHRAFAIDNGLKNIHFLDFSSDEKFVHYFLNSINVFAHARRDGEVCSAAIIEALYHGLPIISHPALHMGHLEQIENCGKVCYSIEEYAREMFLIRNNKDYHEFLSSNCRYKYNNMYKKDKIKIELKSLYSEFI